LCARPRFLGVYCDGGYSDHITVPHPKYLLELDGLDPVKAAPYACSGVTTYSALRKLDDVITSEPIVVIGAGGLGLMCIAILRALGGKGAILVDIDERKREAALEAGALAAVDGRDPEALAQINRAARGPVRGVIDLVGSSASAALGFDVLPKGGKLVIVGLFGGGAPWALPLIPIKAATIQGSYVGNLQELRELMGLARAGAIPAIPITKRKLDQASATLEDLREGKLVGRAVLAP
jgi:propanol-preferring alcohol dehydrogenase